MPLPRLPSLMFGSFLRTFPLALCLCILPACHFGGPTPPEAWAPRLASFAEIDTRDNQPRLQIIIGYGPILSNHSAIRITCPDRQPVFWDPGGGFREADPHYVRKDDVVLVDPPDMLRYLDYRWKCTDDVGSELFEWDITIAQAANLQDIILRGTDDSDPRGSFSSSAVYLECTLAASDFLHRFASDIISVPKIYFLPSDLADVLYTQSPDRLYVFSRNASPLCYIPPSPALHSATAASD